MGDSRGGGKGAAAEFAAVKTSVWWDIENCAVPRGCDPHSIAQNISSALADVGYRGMISSISVYGDTNQITTAVQHALNSTGINLNHVPGGVKDASDKKILVDMLFWAVDNPPPANYLLISGDRDFSNALHQLRMRRYNILLAHAPNVSQALVAAAKCVWLWTSLVAGGPPSSNEPLPSTSVAGETAQSTNLPPGNSRPAQEAYGGAKADNRAKVKQTSKTANNCKHSFSGVQDQIGGSSDKYGSKPKHPIQQTNQVPATTAPASGKVQAQNKSNLPVQQTNQVSATTAPAHENTQTQSGHLAQAKATTKAPKETKKVAHQVGKMKVKMKTKETTKTNETRKKTKAPKN